MDVEGPCGRNLHGVWDGCIQSEKIGDNPKTIAAELRAEISAADRAAWVPASIAAASVIAWANESLAISLAPDAGYCVRKNGECWYADNRREFTTGQPQREVVADDAYLSRQAPIVRQRMKQAGVRLGAILNTVFAPAVAEKAPAPVPSASVPEAIEPTAPGTTAQELQRLTRRIDSLEKTIAALTAEIAKLRAAAIAPQ